ncbi:MAG TPA: alanine racemase [Aliidongia sp.]|uniref:alanine racemase n=1 Tax=Aliidongia sp. TaxID=1914230 RepID=UPI002DDCAABF|nr:alanine racemase [Aliidongia sp.]HEV2676333.1 alanine racemase [Aliidongia sp.]
MVRTIVQSSCEAAVPEAAGAVLTIDLAALCDNYRLLSSRLAGAACAAVVKADAYGLGAARVATALSRIGCRHFFVAHLQEGLALRDVLPDAAEIFVLNGLMPGAEGACLEARLTPVLNSLVQVDAWTRLSRRLGRSLPAVVQIDSGMARLGLAPAEVDQLARDPARLDGVALRAVMSHLACADEPDHPANRAQLAAFETQRRRLPPAPASFANSSGIFLGPDYHFDLARPGAALYGVAPVPGTINPMRDVVRLDVRVIQTREIAAGDAVGYGHAFRATAPTRIATLAVGYADGWLRCIGPAGRAYVGDRALPIAGRVSMDSLTLDISALPPDALKPGDFVELLGPHQPVDQAAAAAGTIGYEILTSLGGRYARHYIGD